MNGIRCYDCNSAFTVAADKFGNWRCFKCLQNWADHIKDVIETVDGRSWCQYGGLAGPKEHIITEDTDMLVVSRKIGEAIVIGDDVTVTVCSINGDRIRLGITAPSETRILRSELEKHDGNDGNDA